MQKPQALAISLGLHAATFLGLMYLPPFGLPTLPPPSPSEYQQGFAGKEDKIVWYKFHDLPDISPPDSPNSRKPLRADLQAKQAVVSSPKKAAKRKQVVVTEAPAIDLPPLDLPNLIAVRLPPKQFITPPDLIRPGPSEIKLPDTPQPPLQQLDAAELPIARLPARPYIPPATVARTPSKIDAPSPAPKYDAEAMPATKIPAVHLPSRAYVPPPPHAPPPVHRIGAATEAPPVALEAASTATVPDVKLPSRAYRPPTPGTAPRSKPNVAQPLIDGPAGDVTIAIAGLNPATTPVKLPAASSPAQFSAGEKVRPDGATSEGTGKGIVVPDLYAHAGSQTKPDLLAMTLATPTSKAFVDDSLRHRSPATAFSTSASTRVSSAPDSRFNGRDVYMMAIQMSNLTSYSGSWLMWYSDREARQGPAPRPISPPEPRRKVDPKYTPSAQADRAEGRVQLYCVVGRDGNVSSIELLRGADERLNRSAEEALSKWEFYPATRDGQPVDVDVVVEIPFVLAPPPLK